MSPRRMAYGPAGDRLVAAAIFAVAFLLRWITLQFDNDYFMHLAWGAQMLHGELPVRDFVEPGFILQTLISYIGLAAGGNQLIAEGLVVCGFTAAGAALVFLTVRRCGGGMVLALGAATIAVVAYPRSYAYPKAFLYPAAMWTIAGYVRKPGVRTLLTMAILTAVAFLFRHDHALWIAGACGAAMIIRQWGSWTRLAVSVAVSTVVAGLIVAPWILWVAVSGHALAFLDNLFAAQSAVTTWHVPDTPVTIDGQLPWLGLAKVEYPRIAVRWAASLTETERAAREQRYGLVPVPDRDGRYRLTNISSSNIRDLLADPVVEDTNDLNRSTRRLRGAPVTDAWVRIQEYVPLIRLRVFPGLVNSTNALALFNWLAFAIPWVALAIAIGRTLLTRRRGNPPVNAWPSSAVIAFALLGIAGYHGLVRGSPDSRLGDVASLAGVLVAFVASSLWAIPGIVQVVTRPLGAMLLAFSIAVASWYGGAYGRLSQVELATVTELGERIEATRQAYSRAPLENVADADATGLNRLAGWLHDCTNDQSRVVVVGFEPQVFVLAGRPFAAGLSFIYEGWSSSERNQRLALERWSHEYVPVVISVDSTWEEFSRDYPLLRRWIDDHYRVAAQSKFDGNKPLTVFMDATASAARTHEATGLPCLR